MSQYASTEHSSELVFYQGKFFHNDAYSGKRLGLPRQPTSNLYQLRIWKRFFNNMPSKQLKWCDSGTPGIAIGGKTPPRRPERQTAKPPRRTAPLSAHDISPSRKENDANFRPLLHHHRSHTRRRDRGDGAGTVMQ